VAKTNEKPKPPASPPEADESLPWEDDGSQDFADGPPTQPHLNTEEAEPRPTPAPPAKPRRLGDELEGTEVEPNNHREPTEPGLDVARAAAGADGPSTDQLSQLPNPRRSSKDGLAVTEATSVPGPAVPDPRRTSGKLAQPAAQRRPDSLPQKPSRSELPVAARRPSNPEVRPAGDPARRQDPSPRLSRSEMPIAPKRPSNPEVRPVEPPKKPTSTRSAMPAVESGGGRKATRSATPAVEPKKPPPVAPRKLTRGEISSSPNAPPRHIPPPVDAPKVISQVEEIPAGAAGGSVIEDESTRPGEKKARVEPGAFSRKKNKGADLDENTASVTAARPMDPKARRNLAIVVGLGALVIGAILVTGVFTALRDRPTLPELQLAYPYGFEGMLGPHGEKAPGATAVSYHYLEEAVCANHTVCLRYDYTGEHEFSGTMIVGKTTDGRWERVGIDGMPFQPRVGH
jgi:hypothetical protein